MKILIETSARHIHLSAHDFGVLFGEGVGLTKRKDLSQPGQFASMERLTVVGPKNKIENVTVLGPLRNQTQVEISLTDARKLGITAPIRISGDIKNTPGCVLVGPHGSLDISNGVIVAKRHIHIDPKSAAKLNLQDNQSVNVRVKSEVRPLIFEDVVVRIAADFSPAMHIDTDEANAAGLGNLETFCEILDCDCTK